LACHVVTSGGVSFGKIERGESVVNIVIERDSGLGGAGFSEHGCGVIAESGVGMDLLHQHREVGGGIDLVKSFVERDESVLNRARALGAEQSVDGALGGGEAVGLDLLEGGDVWLFSPDGGLGDRNFLRGKDGRENEWKTEEDG